MRSQRTRTIGVLTWPAHGALLAVGFAERMLHATLQTATRAGYLLIFMDTANDRDHQTEALATLRDHQVDALLVIAPDLIAYRPVEPMSTIPTILVNCVDPDAGVASIVPDEHGAGSAGGWSRHRALTTIERPDRAMAEEAVTVTLQRLDEEGGAPIPQFSFDCPATNRSSVARPRRPDRRPCRPADRR